MKQKNQDKSKSHTAYRTPLNASGFTLIEVLVAIVILATGLVLVIEGMARTQQAIRISENLVIASAFVEKKLTNAELEVRNLKRLGLNHSSGEWRLAGKEFEWSESVGPYNDETILDQTRVNLVEVNLRWPEGPARTGELKLATLVRNRDKKETPAEAL